jgi:hypothetical protein
MGGKPFVGPGVGFGKNEGTRNSSCISPCTVSSSIAAVGSNPPRWNTLSLAVSVSTSDSQALEQAVGLALAGALEVSSLRPSDAPGYACCLCRMQCKCACNLPIQQPWLHLSCDLLHVARCMHCGAALVRVSPPPPLLCLQCTCCVCAAGGSIGFAGMGAGMCNHVESGS